MKKDKYKKINVWEHRYLMEIYLGRKLRKEEVIHHINGKKYDNRISNLILCRNWKEHTKLHKVSEKTKRKLAEINRKREHSWGHKISKSLQDKKLEINHKKKIKYTIEKIWKDRLKKGISYGNTKGNPITLICYHCKKKFIVKYMNRKRIFCSQNCHYKHSKVERIIKTTL